MVGRAHTEKEKPESLWASLNKLRQLFTRREKIGFGILLLGMIGRALLETFSLGIIPVFLNLAMDPEKALRHERLGAILASLDITTSRDLIIWGGVALIILFLIKTLYVFVYTYFRIRYTQNRHLRLVDRLFAAYMHAPYEFHLNRNTSELLRNIQQEIEGVIYRVLAPILSLAMQGVMVLTLVGLLLVTEPVISLAAVTLFGLAGFGYEVLLKRRLRAHGARAQENRRRIVQVIQQGLGVLKEIRVSRRETYFVQALRRSFREIMVANRFSSLANKMTTPYMEFLAVAGLLGIGIVLVALGRDLQSIAGTLVLFAAVFVRLKSGLSAIVSGVTSLRFNLISINPVYEDIKQLGKGNRGSLEEDNLGRLSAREGALRLRQRLCLEGVWYRYPGASEDALRDINLTISRGESVAFVGPTGSGKTTIVDVILGLLEPQRGKVTVDGRDIRSALVAWQQSIGYIPQAIYLVDDTIRRNVALGMGDSQISDSRVWEVVRAAQLEAFVRALPDGLDTIVGERGVRLSGGQCQRIGIARALYHDPDVLIMDEATSALDNVTERAVVNAVNKIGRACTTVTIAHRLSTVRYCDQFYFVRDGCVESFGTYEELVENSEVFSATA